MALRDINYDNLKENVDEMISLLEYDSMRSAGKAKLNAQHLHSLYFLKEKYETMTKAPVKAVAKAKATTAKA